MRQSRAVDNLGGCLMTAQLSVPQRCCGCLALLPSALPAAAVSGAPWRAACRSGALSLDRSSLPCVRGGDHVFWRDLSPDAHLTLGGSRPQPVDTSTQLMGACKRVTGSRANWLCACVQLGQGVGSGLTTARCRHSLTPISQVVFEIGVQRVRGSLGAWGGFTALQGRSRVVDIGSSG